MQIIFDEPQNITIPSNPEVHRQRSNSISSRAVKGPKPKNNRQFMGSS
jgi:hypothetical protein